MTTTAAPASLRVHRVEVRPTAGDPVGDRLVREARALGVSLAAARSARVYLIEAETDDATLEAIEARLLADPVTESAVTGASAVEPGAALVEVHPLPGVMDPAAQTVERVLRDTFGLEARVSTGWRYDLAGVSQADAKRVAERLLANPVVAGVHTEPFHPAELPKGHAAEFRVTRVPIRDLDDAGLEKLSREGHLFLDLHEMHAVQAEYRELGREPTDIELETLAQTWSEHCVHKTLKATISYRSDDPLDPVKRAGRPGHEVSVDGSVTIHNLLKSTVAAATFELIEGGVDWTLSVFVDNAGIIRFDDETAVCVKVETHNHPSAIEPYGGAATGIGGCIRDIIGTGLAAKPIANTDVFCVAPPMSPRCPRAACTPSACSPGRRGRTRLRQPHGHPDAQRRGLVRRPVHRQPARLLRLRWPDARGADQGRGQARRPHHRPRRAHRSRRHPRRDLQLGRTDRHPRRRVRHAVQIGNAIEEKRVLDAILRARDAGEKPLFSAITDCGAGGFSSAVGEMGEKLGAEVHLDRAPLKYDGLTYTEIWISEAQERMVLAVPTNQVPPCSDLRRGGCRAGRPGPLRDRRSAN
jgi:phosphoribosylformylglycinamidine (FGAM) synthase PurS component